MYVGRVPKSSIYLQERIPMYNNVYRVLYIYACVYTVASGARLTLLLCMARLGWPIIDSNEGSLVGTSTEYL